MSSQLDIGYNPLPAAERVARWSGIIRARLLMLVVSVAISVAIWWWQRDLLGTWGTWILIVAAVIPAVWVVVAIVFQRIARRDLAKVGEGVAMTISTDGVTVGGTDVPWTHLSRFATRLGGPWRSPLFVVERSDGTPLTLPVDYLDVTAGEIDNAVRAYSGGRHGVDLSGLGI